MSPMSKKEKILIENVQRRVTRLVKVFKTPVIRMRID